MPDMKKLYYSDYLLNFAKRTSKALVLVSIALLTLAEAHSQPVWVATTPSAGPAGPVTIPLNYGIDRAGTVYIIILNYNNPNPQSPATVRNQALNPTAPGIVYNIALPVAGLDINKVLQVIAASLAPSTYHTIYLVAADAANLLQPVSVRLNATTLPCPKIQVFNFFGNLGECVNLGAQGMFQVSPLGMLPTGILAGSQWTIDWGDGSPIWTYTSSADNDLPGIQLHNFATTLNCAYIGTWTVKNPCNEFYAVQGVFVIHGREIPLDGDGLLQMEETTTGDVDIVYVCEGSEHDIVLRDISIWNCQNPIVPPPLLPADYDNDKPRRIQFVYGETPAGAIANNINGDVLIGGTNIANGANGYVGPVLGPLAPPNPGTLTDTITIPATCQAGERFYVYLKDWNKCNPFVDQSLDYVDRYFIIEVIDAPPPPIVVTPQVYCFGSVPATISATVNLAGNTINWYDDAALTTLLFTGNPYTHGLTASGNYDFYVTETSGVNGCEGPPAKIDMTIRSELVQPGTITGPAEVCLNATGQFFSVAANPPVMPVGGATEYLWTIPAGWTITAGLGSRQITVNIGGTVGSRSVSVVTRYTSAPLCPSPASTLTITVSPLTVGGAITGGTTPLCIGSSTGTMTLSGHTGTVQRWEKRLLPGGWSNIANTNATYSEIPSSVGTWEYRALVQSGSCSSGYSAVRSIQVDATSVGGTVTGGNTPICLGSSTGNITLSGHTGSVIRWEYQRNAGGWNNIANITTTLNHTPLQSGTFDYRAVIQNGACPAAYSTIRTITVDPASVGGAVSGGTTPICLGSSIGTLTLSGHTGSVVRWQRQVNGGGWSNAVNNTTTYTEIPPLAGTWEFRAQVQSGTCAAVFSTPRTIIVTPPSVGGSITGGSTPICPGISTGTMTLSGHTGSVVRWEKQVNGGGWSNIANTAATYSEIPSSSGTWDYRAYVQNSPCAGVYSGIRTIIVRPQYNAQLHDDISICNNSSASFNIVLSGGASPYTINYTRNGNPQTQLNNYITGTNIATGILTTGNYVYTLTSVVDANGCNAQSLGTSITVTVGAALTGATISGSGNDCSGASSWFALNVNGGAPPYAVTYTFDGGANTVVSGYVNGNHISIGTPAVGSHTVHVVSIQDACMSFVPSLPGDYTFNINAIPSAASTVNNTPSICNNGTTDIILNASVPSSTFTWSVSNAPAVTWAGGKAPAGGSGVIGTIIAQNLQHTSTASTTVTYTITPTGPGTTFCPGSAITRTVIVYPTPVLSSTLTPSAICSGTAFSYTPTSATAGTTFGWNRASVAGITPVGPTSGTNNPNETLTNSTASPIVVTYAYTLTANGCSNTQNVTVTVNPRATLSSGLTPPAICSGTAFSYTPTSATAGTTFSWNRATVAGITPVGPTSGTNNPNETLTNTTTAPIVVTYAYTLTANGCSNTQNVTVTVNPRPVLSGSLTPPAICSGTAFSYIPTSATAGTTFSWNRATIAGITPVGPTSGTDNPNETLTNTTTAPIVVTYAYTLTANGCSNTQNVTVTVNPRPILSSSLTPPAICSGTAFSYIPTSATAGTTFSWNRSTVAGITPVGPTSGTNNPNETLTNTTTAPIIVTYAFTLTANGCSNTQNVPVTVNPGPVLSSSLTPPAICSGTAFSYTPTSATAGTTFSWNRATVAGITPVGPTSGTNNPNETLTNTTTAPIVVTYVYSLTANGCTNTQNVTLTVNPTPVLSSGLTPPAICSGNVFSYTPTSATSGTTFNWNRATVAGITPVGPASGTGNPNEALVNTTTSPIVVTYVYTLSANGCSNTQNVTVTINPGPVLSSSLTPPAICSGNVFSYTPTSATAGTAFSWIRATVAGILPVGPTSGTNNPNETLTNTTAAPITVTYAYTLAALGCSVTQNVTVIVNPGPVLSSSLTPPAICSGSVFSYTPTSATFGTTFNWTRANVVGITPAGPVSGTDNPNENSD